MRYFFPDYQDQVSFSLVSIKAVMCLVPVNESVRHWREKHRNQVLRKPGQLAYTWSLESSCQLGNYSHFKEVKGEEVQVIGHRVELRCVCLQYFVLIDIMPPQVLSAYVRISHKESINIWGIVRHVNSAFLPEF